MKSSSAIIKDLRDSVGMSQREFSEHVGISVRTIQDWEIGRRVPPDYVPRLLRYQLAYEKLCSRRSVLIAFFSGTSAENISDWFMFDKVALPSDKKEDVEILLNKLSEKDYDYIIFIGQKPGITDAVKIETEAHGDVTLYSTADCGALSELFKRTGIEAEKSVKPGNSFCNNIYWNGLNFLLKNGKSSKMLFLHIPFKKNISDIGEFSQLTVEVINQFVNL